MGLRPYFTRPSGYLATVTPVNHSLYGDHLTRRWVWAPQGETQT